MATKTYEDELKSLYVNKDIKEHYEAHLNGNLCNLSIYSCVFCEWEEEIQLRKCPCTHNHNKCKCKCECDICGSISVVVYEDGTHYCEDCEESIE
jgi:hypothetical protein